MDFILFSILTFVKIIIKFINIKRHRSLRYVIYVEKKILNMHLFLLLVEIYEKETVTFRENGNLNIDTYLYITCSVESIIFS